MGLPTGSLLDAVGEGLTEKPCTCSLHKSCASLSEELFQHGSRARVTLNSSTLTLAAGAKQSGSGLWHSWTSITLSGAETLVDHFAFFELKQKIIRIQGPDTEVRFSFYPSS